MTARTQQGRGTARPPADAPRRTRLDPAARRAQLIGLGVHLLATRTLDELSVEDIAHEAGISRGLLFHYFASKQEFHVAVAQAAADDLLARTAPAGDLPPLEALRSGLLAFVAHVAQNPDNYCALVRGAAGGDAELRAISEHTRAVLAGRVVDVLTGVGLPVTGRAVLAVHGWVVFVEECTVRSIEFPGADRRAALRDPEGLIELLAGALPALLVASGEVSAEAVLAAVGASGATHPG